jgi:guanosine-3',5'-bis(diphosphate) 3'-pyrophosphohydrolase
MEDQTRFEKALNEMIALFEKSSAHIDLKKVEDACRTAWEILGDASWESGSPIIYHSMSVAKIVGSDIGLGTDSIVAALLHNVFESTSEKDELIASLPQHFGDQVSSLLDGLFKINSIDTVTISVNSENFRRLLLTLSGDLRVVIIKIADRLEDMRNLDGLPLELQYKYANESSFLYAPLAHRLGIYNIKSELEDLSLKYLKPDEYNSIVQKLEETVEERKNFVSEFVKPIEVKLKSRPYQINLFHLEQNEKAAGNFR